MGCSKGFINCGKSYVGPYVQEWPIWVGVDLDGTLSKSIDPPYDGRIGEPVPAMVEIVKSLIASGIDVRIFTARMAHKNNKKIREDIEWWCEKHLGKKLVVTNIKDPGMARLYDDIAFPVLRDRGPAFD